VDGYTGSAREEPWAWEAQPVRYADTKWAPLKPTCGQPEASSWSKSWSGAADSVRAMNVYALWERSKPTNSAKSNSE